MPQTASCGCTPPHRCVCAQEKRARQVLAMTLQRALDELRIKRDISQAEDILDAGLGLSMRVLEVDGAPDEKTPAARGHSGGVTTRERYGLDHFRKAGRRSGDARREPGGGA